ncbi:MAG: 3'-5' exonuclease [Clostridia bacterium]|nr:3'-5' exonuclease [Clostridia bacterium]
MKYLFFDIECADGGKATICSFGYVICTLDFEVLEQRDILVNPESDFFFEDKKGRGEFTLAYPHEVFYAAPTFDKVYDEIKALLEAPDVYVVGHSVDNDIKFLNMACKRYGMPPLEFEYFDTQRTYRDLEGRKNAISLQNALLELGIETECTFHRSDEDARATMLVLRGLLQKSGKNFEEYSALAYDCTGRTFDFYWGWNGQSRDRFSDVYCVKYTRDFIREIEKGKENYILRPTQNYINFQRYIDKGAPIGEMRDVLEGQKVCISLNYEQSHYKEMLYLVGRIKASGGTYIRRAVEADIFVTYMTDDRGRPFSKCSRHDDLRRSERTDVKVMSLERFLSLLHTSKAHLLSCPEIFEEYFLTVREL